VASSQRPTLNAGQPAGPAVDIQNQVFDPNTGVLTFDFSESLPLGASTRPTVFVHAALFADGTSQGNADAVRRFKRDRVKKVEHLGLYIAALRVADKTTERSAMFAALDSEAKASVT
jgi:hypothetical protein